jgi:hypothetical protein
MRKNGISLDASCPECGQPFVDMTSVTRHQNYKRSNCSKVKTYLEKWTDCVRNQHQLVRVPIQPADIYKQVGNIQLKLTDVESLSLDGGKVVEG